MEFLGDVRADVDINFDIDIDVVTPYIVDNDTSSTVLLEIREEYSPNSPSQANRGKARDESFESSTAVIDEARQTASRLVETTDVDAFPEEEEHISAEEAIALFKRIGLDKGRLGGDDQCGGRTTPENAQEMSAPGQRSHPCSSLERGRSLFDALEALAGTTGGELQVKPRHQEGTELASRNHNGLGDLDHAVAVKIIVENTGDVVAHGVVEERTSTLPTATTAATCSLSSSSATKKEDLSSWKAKRDRWLGSPRPKLKPLPGCSGSKSSKRNPSVPSKISSGTAKAVGSDSIAASSSTLSFALSTTTAPSLCAFGVQTPDMVLVPLPRAENPDQEPKDFFEATLDTMGIDTICGVDEESLRQQIDSLEIVTSVLPILPQDPFANNPVLVSPPWEERSESFPLEQRSHHTVVASRTSEGEYALQRVLDSLAVYKMCGVDEAALGATTYKGAKTTTVPRASCQTPQKDPPPALVTPTHGGRDSDYPFRAMIRNTGDIFANEAALVNQGGPATMNNHDTTKEMFSNEFSNNNTHEALDRLFWNKLSGLCEPLEFELQHEFNNNRGSERVLSSTKETTDASSLSNANT